MVNMIRPVIASHVMYTNIFTGLEQEWVLLSEWERSGVDQLL